jgi:hypothetical protein
MSNEIGLSEKLTENTIQNEWQHARARARARSMASRSARFAGWQTEAMASR